jgi:peptide-methionine (S)-S-oxide reductase
MVAPLSATSGGAAYTSNMFGFGRSTTLPDPADALRGREQAIPTAERHVINDVPLKPPYPAGSEVAEFALGCFWGEEKLYWQQPGVLVTAVGYQGGFTPNPTYEEVCTGKTGHAESVRVVFDPSRISYEQLLKLFWEAHDPTQGMRQGNDRGTQYRSAIFTQGDAQAAAAAASRDMFQAELSKAGYGKITTEILPAPEFYFAEEYHQQYLAKVVNGAITHRGASNYCPNHSTGVTLEGPIVRMEQV